VLSLDIQRGDSSSGFIVTKRGGRERTEIDALEWVRQVSDSGAGELLINSIDADGTKDGFDVELLSHVRKLSSLPIIASGGAGELSHFVEAANCGVDALLAASVFHQGELAISEVKKALSSNGFEVRN
jgi:cyclase